MWTGISAMVCFAGIMRPLDVVAACSSAHHGAYWEWGLCARASAKKRTLFRAGAIPMGLMQPPLPHSQMLAEVGLVLFMRLPFYARREDRSCCCWGLVILPPAVFIMGVDFYRSSNELTRIRYLLLAGPGEYIMLASLLSGQSKPLLRWILPAVAAVGCAIALPTSGEMDRIDFRPLANYFDQHVHGGEPVVFSGGSWGSNITGALLLGLSRYSHKFPRPIALLDLPPASPELVETLKRYPRIWFLCAGPQKLSEYLPGFVDDQERFYLFIGYLHAGHWAGTTK